MSAKQAGIPGVMTGLLSIEIVLVLAASVDFANGGDKNQELLQAARRGQLEKVISLLTSGADVNEKASSQETTRRSIALFSIRPANDVLRLW
ncbi:MAG TPA: hypothetical protein VMC85_16495 [Desulfomonilaceae bacterium]|nr:hypothetical protein [Desulfomonilaceae bacterium]